MNLLATQKLRSPPPSKSTHSCFIRYEMDSEPKILIGTERPNILSRRSLLTPAAQCSSLAKLPAPEGVGPPELLDVCYIEVLQHFNPIPPSEVIRSRNPGLRARHLRLSHTPPQPSTSATDFPLLCGWFFFLPKLPAAGPCMMLQKPLPMRTLLVPQLLVKYIL